MAKRSVVPFGPQHPVLPEPIHIDLVLEDETVVDVVPSIGFIHRGLEGLVKKKDYKEYLYIAERTCGICSFGHGNGYSLAIEKVMGVEVPDRAKYLRVVWAEMNRIHSHLLWAGLMADAFGFENLFYQCWRIREKILDMVELTTGGRIINSVDTIGGVLRDINSDQAKLILNNIRDIEIELKAIRETFLEDYSIQTRTKGVGVLTKQQAHDLGCCGPFARASGINYDMRVLGYDAYGMLDFEPIIGTDGDNYSRCKCRLDEVFQSIDLIRQALTKMPAGEIAVPVKGNPDGESFIRIEQPRGEAVYHVEASGDKFLDRFRVRTPTFANLAGMCETMKGAQYADIPLLVVTIDPCISCTER